MISKEEFKKVWKDTKMAGILNQFYYEHNELMNLQQRIDKAIEILEHIYFLDEVTITNNAVIEIDKAINILQGSDEE